jgi:hypothetical protein
MKNIFLIVFHIGVSLISGVLISGCASKYPMSETASSIMYPLDVCSPDALKEAAAQVDKPQGGAIYNQRTVCRTETTPKVRSIPIPNAAPEDPCLPPPELQVTPTDESDADRDARLEAQAFTLQERCLRTRLEQAFMAKTRAPTQFGIALSGGGSKAAAFAVGVLAGLSDELLLDRADYLSSVSGGSYAAYFYYAHRLFPLLRPDMRRPKATNEELFRDCVASPELADSNDALIKSIEQHVPYCGRLSLLTLVGDSDVPSAGGAYQSLLKCSQDLMRPGDCSMETTSSWRKGVSLPTLGGSIATVIPSFISNSLFDWGLSTSPSAVSYHDGIGLAYGATLVDTRNLSPDLVTWRMKFCGADATPANQVFDCTWGFFDPDPVPLTFDELRVGLLKMRAAGGDGMPFWILNATAPQHRSMYGWLRKVREDSTNSDMFEMTAVSHGSGRYGYVSAPVSIYDMSVLDGVRASAAFLDANQLVLRNRFVRTGAGLGLHLANLDWGIDIPNYNVSTTRRRIHRALPFPFYYLDSLIARLGAEGPMTTQRRDRERSVFIRLIDGGNAENLGVYSLLKRGVRTILIADAAADSEGQFADLCGMRRRLRAARHGLLPQHLYFPGLANFDTHCDRLDNGKKDSGYDLHAWFIEHPLLLGCIRQHEQPNDQGSSCHGISGSEVRLLVAKPAIDLASFKRNQLTKKDDRWLISACWVRDAGAPTQLLNCDTTAFLQWNHNVRKGDCPIFPQHSTVLMTANSSATLFVAYRELARQYIRKDAPILKHLLRPGGVDPQLFEDAIDRQANARLFAQGPHCEPF